MWKLTQNFDCFSLKQCFFLHKSAEITICHTNCSSIVKQSAKVHVGISCSTYSTSVIKQLTCSRYMYNTFTYLVIFTIRLLLFLFIVLFTCFV